MPPLVAAMVGLACAFLFGVGVGAARRIWRRRRGAWTDLASWYRSDPSVVLEEDARRDEGPPRP